MCLLTDILRRRCHPSGNALKTVSPKSNHEEASYKPKFRKILQNNRPILLKNNVLKDDAEELFQIKGI